MVLRFVLFAVQFLMSTTLMEVTSSMKTLKQLALVLALLGALTLPALTRVEATTHSELTTGMSGATHTQPANQRPRSYVCDRWCLAISSESWNQCMETSRGQVDPHFCESRRQAELADCVIQCNEQYGDILP